jgi:hypothetical protein
MAVIAERQCVLNDESEAQAIRDAWIDELVARRHDPDTSCVFFTSDIMADVLQRATGQRHPNARAARIMSTVAIPELSRYQLPGSRQRGWIWRGQRSQPEAQPVPAGQDYRRRA